VSAVASSAEILGVFRPGSHGSTYGGNPLACAVARAALRVTVEERLAERSAELGRWVLEELRGIGHSDIRSIRGRGLLIGVELAVPARAYCERLKELGVLCKETHDFVIRLAPPLVTSKEDLAWMVERVREAFAA
jgi:ornithine--oxo-acid transaminase